LCAGSRSAGGRISGGRTAGHKVRESGERSMGKSNAEQRNDDGEESVLRTMCSEEPDTPSGESPLRESLQHSVLMEGQRDMNSVETPRPRYNPRSTASTQQCVPSLRYNLRSTRALGDEWPAGSAAAIKASSSPIVQEHVSYKQALRSSYNRGSGRQLSRARATHSYLEKPSPLSCRPQARGFQAGVQAEARCQWAYCKVQSKTCGSRVYLGEGCGLPRDLRSHSDDDSCSDVARACYLK
jgi:hypothetical protein